MLGRLGGLKGGKVRAEKLKAALQVVFRGAALSGLGMGLSVWRYYAMSQGKLSGRQLMTAQEYTTLQMELAGESNAILARTGLRPFNAYNAMLREPEMLSRWWGGAFEQSEDEGKIIDAAAKAFAAKEVLPNLSLPQLARLAIRLRIGSRIIRAISSRQHVQPKGWFPNKLRRMNERALVEWVLVDGWHFWGDVFDEALTWADGVEPPIAPCIRQPPAESLGAEPSTFAE